MPPDFLNSREDAILVWAVLLIGFALSRDARGLSRSFAAVLASAVHPKLLLLFATTFAYTAAFVYTAYRLGVWHTTALKATVYWFIGTAALLVGRALTEGARDDDEFIRKVLRRVVAWTVAVEFVVNVYAMPLAFELVGVGIVLVFSMVQVVAQHDASTPEITRRFIDGVLVTMGLVFLGYFAVRVLRDIGGFLTRENAEDFFVGPALTLVLIPFLYLAAWVSRRELENLRKRFRDS